jgi:hypothetical protein
MICKKGRNGMMEKILIVDMGSAALLHQLKRLLSLRIGRNFVRMGNG